MAIVHQFPRRAPAHGIQGLFWLLPRSEQHARIRQLAKSRLTPETIATITRISVREINSIIEAQP